MCHVSLLAGLVEEAHEALAHAETLAPDAIATLEASLQFHELVQAPPETIQSLIRRIKTALQREPYHRADLVLPSYYLF